MKISIRPELRHSLYDRCVVTIRTGMMPANTSNPANLAVMQSSLVLSGDSLYSAGCRVGKPLKKYKTIPGFLVSQKNSVLIYGIYYSSLLAALLPGSHLTKITVHYIKKFIQKYLEILKNDTQLIICTS